MLFNNAVTLLILFGCWWIHEPCCYHTVEISIDDCMMMMLCAMFVCMLLNFVIDDECIALLLLLVFAWSFVLLCLNHELPCCFAFFNLPRNPCGSWLVCIVCGYLVCCIIVMIICCYSFVVFDRMPMPLPNPNCCMNFLKHESWLVVLLFHWPLANENISFSCTKRWVLVKWVQNYTITILWLVFDH